MLPQLALQRPPMHSEHARGRGDVAVVPAQHPVDVLPLQPVHGQRLFAHRGRRYVAIAVQGRDDLIRVGGLGQIVVRAELDRFYRRRDASLAGKHQDSGVMIQVHQLLDEAQSGAAWEFQIDDREIGTMFRRHGKRTLIIVCRGDVISLSLQRARQNGTKHFIVVHEQETR
jgi:hypothetical protein